MDAEAYQKIKKQYATKKKQKEDLVLEKKRNFYLQNPKLQELEEKRNMQAIETTRNVLNASDMDREIEEENMSIKLAKIDDKIEKEWKRLGVSKQDFEPEYDCVQCQDSGLIQKDHKTVYCPCFLQAVINETYQQSNMLKIGEENFDTFDFGYYSEQVDKEKYGITKSPRQNMEQIQKIAKEFARKLKDKEQKNLLFIGNTGLGKTFLTNAIAKAVLDQSQSVIYQTAPIFMDQLMRYKFSFEEKSQSQYDKIFDVDLLIIDDLGTETLTNNKYTELFNVINTRLLKDKKIVISTNLTLNQLFERYDERVISRLIGEFRVCKFVGEDIRLKKKRIRQDILKK